MAIVTFVLRLKPYGILAIMASTIATSDFAAIWTLGKFMIASYAALITMYIIHLVILTILGINPVKYMKKHLKYWPLPLHHVQVLFFTVNIQTQTTRLGVPEGIANFSATLVYLLDKMVVQVSILRCLQSWLHRLHM